MKLFPFLVIPAAYLFPFHGMAAPNYVASYQTQFQYVLGPNCQGPSPVLHVGCQGDIAVLSPVQCNTSIPQTDSNGWNFVECTFAFCQEEGCVDEWRVVDDEIASASFGEILFECSGDTMDAIDAYTSYEASGRGTCNANAVGQTNIHVARLGVQCDDGAFDFDDYYFECSSNVDPFTTERGFLDSHSCASGFVCDFDNGNCDNFDFERIQVRADHTHYRPTCVEWNKNGSILPTEPPWNPGDGLARKTTFRGGWAILTDGNDAECSSGQQNIRFECRGGTIEFDEFDGTESAACGRIGENILDCTEEAQSDGFSNAVFNCIGIGRPADVVATFREANVTCNAPSTVFHALQLGIQCRTGYEIGDEFVECGSESHVFDRLDRVGEDGARWTCAQSIVFPADSSSGSSLVIADTSMRTDQYWLDNAPHRCYDIVPGVTRPPSAAPAFAPLTMAPAAVPTSATTRNPTMPPTRDFAVAEEEDDGRSPVGPVVGGTLGGIVAVVAVVFSFVVLRKRRQKLREKATEKSVPHAEKELEMNVVDGSKTLD